MNSPYLTFRERDVLGLLARGYTNPQIASELYIVVKTVEHHINSLYGKLQSQIMDGHPRVRATLYYLSNYRDEEE